MGILKDRYKLVAARDGEKALKLALCANPPDLILLDIMMPGLSGIEVCRLLKRSEESAPIPVLFITGKNDAADIHAGLEAGGEDFIAKPFNAQLVQRRVATHIELSQLRKKSKTS